MCGSGTTTQVSNAIADPRVSANYDYITGRAKGVADVPYEYYPGNLVAPISGQMQSGFDIINQSQGVAAPFISQATQYAQQGASPISGAQIQRYLDPNQNAVIDATMANINEMNASQRQGLIGNAISKGAWGGDRAGVAQAELSRQQGLAAGQTLAGLHSANYAQALQAAQQDQQRQAQAAYTMGALGQEAQSTALQGANAQIGAGQLQQQQGQNEINAAYGQYQQAKQYPFNTTQWLAGILGGQAGQMGGTSTTSSPAPGVLQQAVGAGAGIAGILGATGAFGSSGWLWSDERLKENIEPIGRAFDGQMIYRYNFKGDPTTQIGFLAQEVERHAPDAVRTIDGVKGVDYHDATDEAADRGGFATGGIIDFRSPIIPTIDSYTPDVDSPAPGPLVSEGLELKSISKPAYEQATRGFAPGGSVLVDPYRREIANDRRLRRWLEGLSRSGVVQTENAYRDDAPLPPPRPMPDISTKEGLLRALGPHLLDHLSAEPPVALPNPDTFPRVDGYDEGGVVPYDMDTPFPALGRVNGMPVPLAAGVNAGFRSPMFTAKGNRIPRAPRPGGTGGGSDIGGDVIRLAQMLRASGLGKSAGMGMRGGESESIGLKSGGRAPRQFGGEADEVDPAEMARLELAARQGVLTVPIPELPPIAIKPAPGDVKPPVGFVPITAAIDSLSDAPQGVAAPPPSGGSFYDRWAAGESGNNPQAVNPSGARGRLQVMPGTYRSARGAIPGLPDDPRLTTEDQDRKIADWYRRQSASVLAPVLGRQPTDGELGLATLAGPAGASALLKLDPATPIASLPNDFWQRMGEKFTHQTFLAQNPAIAKLGTVGNVVDFFRQRFEGGSDPAPTSVASAPPASGVAAPPPSDDAGDDKPTGVAPKEGDFADRFMQSPWLALANLGFGMAASKSPHFLGALGEGGLQGTQTAMAQGKMRKELQMARAMEEHRKAMLGVSQQNAERQMRLAEETARRNAASERDRLRIIEMREGREAREADEKRTDMAHFKPTKDVDPATGYVIYRNKQNDEKLMGPNGLITREEAKTASTYKHDPLKDRTLPMASGDITIPALDERELSLPPRVRLEADKRYKEILDSAKSSGDVARRLQLLKDAYAKLPTTGPMAPGPWAEAWRNVAGQANALSTSLGIPAFFDPAQVGSLDAMRKQTIDLAAAATKAFNGSRPTNFDFEQMLKATPGAALTPQAFAQVVGAMEAQSMRSRDLAKYAGEYIKHRRTAYGVEDNFGAQRPDDYYFKQAGIAVPRQGADAGPATQPAGAPPRVSSKEEYDRIPSGGEYIDARTGQRKRKQ